METDAGESGEAIIDLPKDRETGLRVGRIVLFGPTGSGKTLMGCALARQMAPPSFKDVFVLSPKPTAANNLPNAQWYKISPVDKSRVEAFMGKMKDMRALLVVDEADSYFGGSGRTYGTPSMFEAVNFGRNDCLAMIVIAHGTNVAPKNLIENSAGVMFFRTTTPGLLDYAESYMPEVPDPAHTLRNLPDYVALVYAPLSKEKFVGFAKLDVNSGVVNIWKPEQEPETPESITPSSNPPEEVGESSASLMRPEATSSNPSKQPLRSVNG
jgi:hypothetical protein